MPFTFAMDLAEPFAKHEIDAPQNRRQHAHDRKQRQIVKRHQGGGSEDLPAADDAHEEYVLDAGPHRFDVGRRPADDPAELGPVEEAHSQLLQVAEDGVPQVLHDRLAQFQRQPLPIVQRELGEERQPQVAEHAQRQPRLLTAGDRAVDDPADRPGQQRQLHRPQQHEHEQLVALLPVRRRERIDPGDERPLQRPRRGFLFVFGRHRGRRSFRRCRDDRRAFRGAARRRRLRGEHFDAVGSGFRLSRRNTHSMGLRRRGSGFPRRY
jgi:hypothetical protein